MITLTKEWLLKTIAELEEERDAVPGIVNEDAVMALEAMKRALASLMAEPVAWTDEQELRDVDKYGCGYLFTANPVTPNADPHRVIKLYAAPPAPVSERELAQMFGIGSVFKPQILSGNEVDCDNCAHYQPYVCHGEGCPAAMLQGADGALTNEDTKLSGGKS